MMDIYPVSKGTNTSTKSNLEAKYKYRIYKVQYRGYFRFFFFEKENILVVGRVLLEHGIELRELVNNSFNEAP